MEVIVILVGSIMAAKLIWDNWGTRSGIDRRQRQDPWPFADRRKRTERRSGSDRRKSFYIHRRTALDLREAFRDL
jgi:hypothetical protein